MSKANILTHDGKEYVLHSSYKGLKTKYDNRVVELEEYYNKKMSEKVEDSVNRKSYVELLKKYYDALQSKSTIINELERLYSIEEECVDVERTERIDKVGKQAMDVLNIFTEIKEMVKQ